MYEIPAVTVLSLQGSEMTALDRRAFERESLRPAPHYTIKVPLIVYDQNCLIE